MTPAKPRLARAMRAQVPPMRPGQIAVEPGLSKSTIARNLRETNSRDDRPGLPPAANRGAKSCCP